MNNVIRLDFEGQLVRSILPLENPENHKLQASS